MRNRLLLSLLMGMFALGLHAQAEVKVLSDITSKIANADFKADSPITELICTYDYDMANNGTTLYGQQAVTGWTAANLSDNTLVSEGSSNARTDGLNARAAGVFAYRADETAEGPGLGSASYLAPLAIEGFDGQGLGMVAVWGVDIKYSQDVTLPAGGYMMVVTLQNVSGGAEVQWSNMGYTTADGTDYRSTKVNYYVEGTFETDTILFRLKAETAGQVVLGYKSGNFGSADAPHIFIDNVKLYTIDENYFDQLEIAEAKEKLLALIEEGKIRDADTSASQAVYDNPNATLAEVLAAIEAQKAINESSVTDLSEFFIVNPHFSQDEPIGDGITTYDYDMEDPNGSNGKKVTHYGMQPVTGWTASDLNSNARASGVFAIGSDAFLGGGAFLPPKTMSNGDTEGKLLGFVSVWSAKSQYTQNVTIPAGKYTLVFSYYNGGGTSEVSANLMGFVSEDGTEYLGQTKKFAVGTWLTESIEFEIAEETTGYFSMGYTAAGAGSAAMPHLFIDGVSLYYVGTDIDPSLLALNSAINQGNRVLDEVFNADLKAQLEEAVQAAEDLFASHAGDEEANKAAAAAVTSLMDAVNASIDAYKKLQNFHDTELLTASEKYDEDRFPELGGALQSLLGEVEDAIQDGAWDNEKIDEVIASFMPLVRDGVQKAWDAAVASGETLDEDLDISVLFDQLAYTYSSSAVSNTSVPDKEWKYGDATNFKTQYGTAEVWNQSPFTVSRTLADMPAGKYTITTKAFFRMADNATNYAEWDPTNTPEANIFAGSVKEGLTNVASIASADLSTLDGAASIDETLYVPNSQHGAYLLFNDEAYTDALQKSVSTVLPSKGDLTFGITADEMQGNCWVVWYSFTVAYNAPDRNALFDVLDALDLETQNLQDKEEVAYNQAADAKINDAQAKNEERDGMSDDQLRALITEYEAAIAYAEESITLAGKLKDTYTLYNDYLMPTMTEDSDEPTFNELLGNIDAAMSDGYESNEQIQGFIDGLADGWTAYVQYPVLETSSEENPGDITAAIYNAGFVDPVSGENNANGWTSEYDGGNTGGQFETFEFYNNNSFRISQTLKGLAQGYYRVRVQAFYRAGSNDVNADTLTLNPDSINHVYLFTQTESANRTQAIKNVLERENIEGELDTNPIGAGSEVEVKNYKDYESFYVPNNREAFAAYNAANIYWNQLDCYVAEGETLTLGLYKDVHIASDWCPFDNFQLFYLGTEPPTAVEGVEADGIVKVTDEAIFNLAGQRVSKAVKGLYIIGGKKVLVK